MIRRALRLCGPLLVVVGLASCVVPPASRPAPGPSAPTVSFTTVEYSPGLEADVRLPHNGASRGTIVLVHGGAFIGGSRSDVAAYTDPVLHQLDRGFGVLNVDYRLTTATAFRYPAAVTDISAAVDWVRTQGPAHGLDPSTIIVAGHSSGATLAALIGLGANNPDGVRGATSPVDGWIAISGLYDLRQDGIPELQRRLWLGPDADPTAVASASAIASVDAGDPPGYIVHGANDTLVPLAQAQRLFAALATVGQRPWLDVVTDPACDGHVPTCAVNTAFLDLWVDRVVERRV